MKGLRNMNAYIIASPNNISLAKNLLNGFRSVKIILGPTTTEGADAYDELKNKMEKSDIILAIIDKDFSENLRLNFEVRIAKMVAKKDRSIAFIPVALNKADIPKGLAGESYIICSTDSAQDLHKTKLKIKNEVDKIKYYASKEHLKKKSDMIFPLIIITIAIEIFAMMFVNLFLKIESVDLGQIKEERVIIIFGMACIMLALCALPASYLQILKKQRHEEDENELQSYSRRLQQAITLEGTTQTNKVKKNTDRKKQIDALGRMMINLEDIKEFYTWSQRQAKASFVLAVVMCALGFILMAVATILPILFGLSYQVSIIPAIGGAITELIAGTALVVYRSSLQQLSHYHKALHEDERFLSSVNLLGKFRSAEAQDEMLREIIRSEIQINLSGLPENENFKIYSSKASKT